MEKPKVSSSVATVCTLTMAVIGLASCNAIENSSLAQLKSVRTVAPSSQPASVVVAADGSVIPSGATTLADASGVTSAPLDPATLVLQKTGRLPSAAESSALQVAELSQPMIATDPMTGLPTAQEFYVIPGRVAVPTPRPGTSFASAAASMAPVATGTPLQQMAALQVEPAPQAQTSTQLMARMAPAPEAITSDNDPSQSTVMVASANNDQNFYIIPGRVAVPQPRPGSELAYAPNAAGSAIEAISMQLPAQQQQVQMASLAPGQQSIVQTQGDTAHSRNKLNDLIFKYATLYGVPEHFVHRVAKRESTYNPKAYNSGNYGLMQIRLNTAKGLGYKGDANGLFDAETNLKYAVKYLRGAWLVADGNEDKADKLYMKGYYYDAKRRGMLKETLSK